jgi:prefoldin subunit 5
MSKDYTIEDAIEMLEDQKAKLENKLDKTVQTIHTELEKLDYLLSIVRSKQSDEATGE